MLIAGALLVVAVPVVYRVLEAGDVGSPDARPRRPLTYLVAATLASALAVAAVPLPATDGRFAVLVRGVVFLAAFGAVSWLAIRAGRGGAG